METVSIRAEEFGIPFEARETLPDFDGLPPVSKDSASYISDDRDRDKNCPLVSIVL